MLLPDIYTPIDETSLKDAIKELADRQDKKMDELINEVRKGQK